MGTFGQLKKRMSLTRRWTGDDKKWEKDIYNKTVKVAKMEVKKQPVKSQADLMKDCAHDLNYILAKRNMPKNGDNTIYKVAHVLDLMDWKPFDIKEKDGTVRKVYFNIKTYQSSWYQPVVCEEACDDAKDARNYDEFVPISYK